MSGLKRLELENFRCHAEVRLTALHAPWIILSGRNGAGKTSLLEAIYAAARGRSFRTRVLSQLIRAGTDEARVFLQTAGSPVHRLGVAFRGAARKAHLDDMVTPRMARVASEVPVEYLGGEIYRLIDGSPAARRRFLDWGLFHVEPQFFRVWQAWFKAHRHRNDLLRRGNRADMDPWTATVCEYGETLTSFRSRLVERLNEGLRMLTPAGDDFSGAELRFRPGWREETLVEAFQASARREQQTGRAVVGPQYDDWILTLAGHGADGLSRGQSKLACILLVRARGELMEAAGRSALLLVDDLMADFDASALESALRLLDEAGSQIWLSALEDGAGMSLQREAQRFHVEPGRVSTL